MGPRYDNSNFYQDRSYSDAQLSINMSRESTCPENQHVPRINMSRESTCPENQHVPRINMSRESTTFGVARGSPECSDISDPYL
jgi:hypothetical protein